MKIQSVNCPKILNAEIITSPGACFEMGGAGDPSAPVGDPPTGTAASNVAKSRSPLARAIAPVPAGEALDGTACRLYYRQTIFQTRS